MKFDRFTPCPSCPYRTDAPRGLWHADEFLNLLRSERDQIGAVFGCHEGNKLPTDQRRLCIGWLLDQRKRRCPSIALRMLLIQHEGALNVLERAHSRGMKLYPSLQAMCRANGVHVTGDEP
jgi:hypothetical protein